MSNFIRRILGTASFPRFRAAQTVVAPLPAPIPPPPKVVAVPPEPDNLPPD